MFVWEGVVPTPENWAPLPEFEAAVEHPPPPPIMRPPPPPSLDVKKQKVLAALNKIRYRRQRVIKPGFMDIADWHQIFAEDMYPQPPQQQQQVEAPPPPPPTVQEIEAPVQQPVLSWPEAQEQEQWQMPVVTKPKSTKFKTKKSSKQMVRDWE